MLYRQLNIVFRKGDPGQIPSQALIALQTSPEGPWHGGVHDVIHRYAGSAFHQALAKKMPRNLQEARGVFVTGDNIGHSGSFRHVVFVVAHPEIPLQEQVAAGLQSAYQLGFTNVSFPLIGMIPEHDTMLPLVTAREIMIGTQKAVDQYPAQLMTFNIVVGQDPKRASIRLLEHAALVVLADSGSLHMNPAETYQEALQSGSLAAVEYALTNAQRDLWIALRDVARKESGSTELAIAWLVVVLGCSTSEAENIYEHGDDPERFSLFQMSLVLFDIKLHLSRP